MRTYKVLFLSIMVLLFCCSQSQAAASVGNGDGGRGVIVGSEGVGFSAAPGQGTGGKPSVGNKPAASAKIQGNNDEKPKKDAEKRQKPNKP